MKIPTSALLSITPQSSLFPLPEVTISTIYLKWCSYFARALVLSFLEEGEQSIVFETMESEEVTPSVSQAAKLKKFSQGNRLDENVILSVLQEEKGNQHENIKLPREKISKYFSPGTTSQKIEETIIKALELYRKRQLDMER